MDCVLPERESPPVLSMHQVQCLIHKMTLLRISCRALPLPRLKFEHLSIPLLATFFFFGSGGGEACGSLGRWVLLEGVGLLRFTAPPCVCPVPSASQFAQMRTSNSHLVTNRVLSLNKPYRALLNSCTEWDSETRNLCPEVYAAEQSPSPRPRD